MKEMLRKLIREEDGQGMVEYGLIIAGVALAVVAAIWLLGPAVSDMFENTTTRINTPPGS